MRRVLALLCLPVSAVAIAACGNEVSKAGFEGERHEAAQTIVNLQTHATAAEEGKICAEDLAAALLARLGGSKDCEAAIKSQLNEVDSLEVSVQSVQLAASGKDATAEVKSIHDGKSADSALSLVKEAGKWKISGL